MAFATPRVAVADEPTKADKKKASKLVLQASRHKRNGDKFSKKKKTERKAMGAYAKAATAYIEAYSLVEEPATVFKLAEIYAARGERTWALRGYLRYLKLEPDGADAMEAGERIAELEPLVAADAEAGKALPEDEHPELDPTVVFGLAEAPKVEEPEAPAVEEPIEEPLEKKKIRAKPRPAKGSSSNGTLLRWSGIGLAGVGVVFLGVGTSFGIAASSAASDLSSKTGQWDLNDRKKITQGEADASKMVLFTVLGSGAIIAGGAVYYLGWRAGKRSGKREMAWTPIVGPGQVALTMSGSF
jgi:hypothetical protein